MTWRRRGLAMAAGGTLAALLTGSAMAFGPIRDSFDHDEHQGLFPTCTGCHAGASASGRPLFPEPGLCVRCHDGEGLDAVEWRAQGAAPSNLTFVHVDHATSLQRALDDPVRCTDCHETTESGEPGRGAAESCGSCHAHAFQEHLEGPECSTCHVPLARSSFTRSEVIGLPRPEDHEGEPFLAVLHGAEPYEADRCSTCHTADRCAACHVDPSLAEIERLGYAPEGMTMPAFGARYPVPEDHDDPEWLRAHGPAAGVAEQCTTCHLRDDCATCHLSPAADESLREIPEKARAPGVGLDRKLPDDHSAPGFLDVHGMASTAAGATCSGCHVEDQCVQCHEGARSPEYHPRGYAAGHAADAFMGFSQCSSCHSPVVFCRGCHVASGIGADPGAGPEYHDAEPLWFLRHGQAARQGMESCASCHTQVDCTRCHSTVGAFRVSPHGPDFDPETAWEKNFRVCGACHLTRPVGP